jgi:hypothetical protein
MRDDTTPDETGATTAPGRAEGAEHHSLDDVDGHGGRLVR